MLTNEAFIYPIKITGSANQQIYCSKQYLLKQFNKRKGQILKFKSLHNFKDTVKIDQLHRLCSVNNIAVKRIDQQQILVDYQIGNSGIQIITKYVEMIVNVEYAIEYPQSWINDGKQYSQVQVKSGSMEYIEVKKIFPYKIKIIKRVQNWNAYSRYFNERKFLQKLNNGKKILQKYLFHGTRTMNPSQITADKEITFNINYSADKNYMGRATYFAEKAEYSHNYRFKVSNTVGIILLCTVLVGDSQRCPKLHVDYRDTDFKDKQKTVRYQSMTQIYDGSPIYTVYKNNRAYPMYLLEYDI